MSAPTSKTDRGGPVARSSADPAFDSPKVKLEQELGVREWLAYTPVKQFETIDHGFPRRCPPDAFDEELFFMGPPCPLGHSGFHSDSQEVLTLRYSSTHRCVQCVNDALPYSFHRVAPSPVGREGPSSHRHVRVTSRCSLAGCLIRDLADTNQK
jgi:hypothetical protein